MDLMTLAMLKNQSGGGSKAQEVYSIDIPEHLMNTIFNIPPGTLVDITDEEDVTFLQEVKNLVDAHPQALFKGTIDFYGTFLPVILNVIKNNTGTIGLQIDYIYMQQSLILSVFINWTSNNTFTGTVFSIDLSLISNAPSNMWFMDQNWININEPHQLTEFTDEVTISEWKLVFDNCAPLLLTVYDDRSSNGQYDIPLFRSDSRTRIFKVDNILITISRDYVLAEQKYKYYYQVEHLNAEG